MASSVQVRCGFNVRQSYPHWTSRRLVNGVVNLDELILGDAMLEEIITGVMDNIKSWLIANNRTEYNYWVNIEAAPKSIRRATTYGVVASLYARNIFAPLRSNVVSIPPVSAKVLTAEENAMDYWEEKMEEKLEAYLTLRGASRILVDTIDEEPVFDMDDIPLWRKLEP